MSQGGPGKEEDKEGATMCTVKCLMSIHGIYIYLFIHLFIYTRPKPAYGWQGLDWIVGSGYSFVVFSTNKTMETNQKSWKLTKNHGNQTKTMINHETTLKNHGNQPKTMRNHETT